MRQARGAGHGQNAHLSLRYQSRQVAAGVGGEQIEVSTHCIGQQLATPAFVGHMQDIDTCFALDLLQHDVAHRPNARRGQRQLARVGLGLGDHVVKALAAERAGCQQQHRRIHHRAHWCKVGQCIVGGVGQVRQQRQRADGGQRQRVAIAGLGHSIHSGDATSPRPVVYNHRLPQHGREPLCQQACDGFRHPACRVGHDDAHRLGRPGRRLRMGHLPRCTRGGDESGSPSVAKQCAAISHGAKSLGCAC